MKHNKANPHLGIMLLSAIVSFLLFLTFFFVFPCWKQTSNQVNMPDPQQERLDQRRLFLKVKKHVAEEHLAKVFPGCEIVETKHGLRVSGESLLRELESVGIASESLWNELCAADNELIVHAQMEEITFPIGISKAGERYVCIPAAIFALIIQ